METRKYLIFVLAFAFCMMIAAGALAGTSISGSGSNPSAGSSDLAERLRAVPDFKFFHHPEGIGYGVCPVYSAPSVDAYRLSNGRACVATDFDMYEAGFDSGGWLLVRYETNDGGVNVGYIPPDFVRGFRSRTSCCKTFDYIPVTAEKEIHVTNNPLLRGSAFAVLDPGEKFHILAKYTYHGDWYYIECFVDGQVARGFIDRGESTFYLGDQEGGEEAVNAGSLGNPDISPLGTSRICDIIVSYGRNGERKIVHGAPGYQTERVQYVDAGKRYPCYSVTTVDGIEWYYIWMEDVSKWGWISSEYASRGN